MQVVRQSRPNPSEERNMTALLGIALGGLIGTGLALLANALMARWLDSDLRPW